MTDYRDDDALMDALRRSAQANDPPPNHVLEAARAALDTRRLDEELAALLVDSAAQVAEAVRGEDDVRLLAFGTSRVSVELHLEYLRTGISLRGLVSGGSGEVTIEQRGGSRTLPIDAEGWFAATDVPRGATRMRLRTADAAPVSTSWVLL